MQLSTIQGLSMSKPTGARLGSAHHARRLANNVPIDDEAGRCGAWGRASAVGFGVPRAAPNSAPHLAPPGLPGAAVTAGDTAPGLGAAAADAGRWPLPEKSGRAVLAEGWRGVPPYSIAMSSSSSSTGTSATPCGVATSTDVCELVPPASRRRLVVRAAIGRPELVPVGEAALEATEGEDAEP
jgi:hypothetical protein